MHHLDWCANVVHTFWPVTMYSSPLSTARVFKEARSEPDSGSLKPWHHISSALRIGERKRAFWSSVPWAITVGPPIVSPSTLAICGARARAISSKKIACSIWVAPAPPYSLGHVSPAQPRSLSLRCHSRRKAKESSSPSGSRPGWLSAIQERSVSRNSSSAGESVRSTRRDVTRREAAAPRPPASARMGAGAGTGAATRLGREAMATPPRISTRPTTAATVIASSRKMAP